MNPEFNNFNIYTIFPVLTALAYSTTIVIQHKTADKDNLFSQTFHLLFVAMLLSLIASIVFGNGQFNIYESNALQFMFRKWTISFDTSLIVLIVDLNSSHSKSPTFPMLADRSYGPIR